MSDRKNVTKVLESCIDLEYDTLDKAIQKLSDLRDKFSEEYPMAYLERTDWDSSAMFELRGERPETDEEIAARDELQRSYKERQIEAARKLLRDAGEI